MQTQTLIHTKMGRIMNKFEYRALQGLKYKAGQIDRRTFLRSLLATGLALPGALSIASSVEAATPKKGG